ncbi:MAG: hypothetical protein PHO02_05420 [Candidatus Nanoarchaeia archaeon]|nr:hypothetical protein [Candidatus Nanoarchaeia archaeon]
MKKIVFISFCIFILISAFALAQNETNVSSPPNNITLPPADNSSALPAQENITIPAAGNMTEQESPPPSLPPAVPAALPTANEKQTTCGNGRIDAGEDCVNCLRDVCKKGQQCNPQTRQCETIVNYTTYIIVGIGIFVLLGLFFFAKRLMKKKEEPFQPRQQPAAVQAPKPVVQQPPSGQQQTPQPLAQQQPAISQQPSPAANAPVQMPPSMPETSPEQKKIDQEQGFEEMSQTIDEHPGETMPQKFIRQMREKGWNDERIRMKMKESGWSETQIALEFLKAPKFVKKS